VGELAAEQWARAVDDVVTALEGAYLAAGGWEDADLLPAHTLAAAAGAVLIVATPDLGELPVPPGLSGTRGQLRDHGDPGREDRIAPWPGIDDPAEHDSGAESGTGDAPEEDTTVPDTGGGSSPAPDPGAGSPSAPDSGSGTGQRTGPGPDERRDTPTGGAGSGTAPDATPKAPTGSQNGPEPSAQMVDLALVSATGRVGGTQLAVDATRDDVVAREETSIVIDGQVVGTATLLFVAPDLPDATQAFQAQLGRSLVVGAVVAALLALVVTVFVTTRLTRPLRQLTADVERIGHGGTTTVSDDTEPPAPGEIGVLTAAIDGMARDLRRQERLRRALVADVGHELRTPVTILLGELEALRDGVLPLDDEELASLHEEVQRIARLVQDVDSLADAEASGFTLDGTRLELDAVVADAARGFAQPFAAADLTLVLSLEPVDVVGDRRRLEQVVRNLLSNALRYAPPGTTVEVEVHEAGPDAVLRVEDRGPGFEPAELPHVFERFWRGTAATAVGGSGIGLAVVAEVVAAHGGQAMASNRLDGGALLTVRLPRAATEAARPPVTADASPPAVPPAARGARSRG
jgi:signal transduction histidine kinase